MDLGSPQLTMEWEWRPDLLAGWSSPLEQTVLLDAVEDVLRYFVATVQFEATISNHLSVDVPAVSGSRQ